VFLFNAYLTYVHSFYHQVLTYGICHEIYHSLPVCHFVCAQLTNVKFKAADTLWIAMASSVIEELQVTARLSHEFPKLTIKIIKLAFDTRGAAETLFVITQSMSAQEALRRTISLDCDVLDYAIP
jgi:hypothetical protein